MLEFFFCDGPRIVWCYLQLLREFNFSYIRKKNFLQFGLSNLGSYFQIYKEEFEKWGKRFVTDPCQKDCRILNIYFIYGLLNYIKRCKIYFAKWTELQVFHLFHVLDHLSSDSDQDKRNGVVCPNFGHPALTSSFTKYKFKQVKIVLQQL